MRHRSKQQTDGMRLGLLSRLACTTNTHQLALQIGTFSGADHAATIRTLKMILAHKDRKAMDVAEPPRHLVVSLGLLQEDKQQSQ